MKKVLLRFMLAFLLFGISGTYILANESYSEKSTRNANSYIISESGSWVYRTEGIAKAEHSTSYIGTRGKGYSNYYFWVYVRNATGTAVATADASNGVEKIAQVKRSSSLNTNHTHTASGMPMY